MVRTICIYFFLVMFFGPGNAVLQGKSAPARLASVQAHHCLLAILPVSGLWQTSVIMDTVALSTPVHTPMGSKHSLPYWVSNQEWTCQAITRVPTLVQ